MRRFYVTRNKDGFKYTENPYASGWNHCPDRVQDRASLLKFLTEEGRYNDPIIVFSDKNGKPVKIYEITRNNGHIMATIDGSDLLPLIRQHFVSDAEAADFFKANEVSAKVISEAELLQPQDRLKHYQDNATLIVKDEFDKLISDKLSNANITDYFKKQAAIDNMGAEIIFR